MLTNNEIRKAEKLGWTLTDDDCCQWQRGIIDEQRPLVQCYEMCQIVRIGEEYRVCHGVVPIGAVSEEELDVLVHMYGYNSLDEFVQESAPTSDFVVDANGAIDRENSPAWVLEYGLLAEMDFETNALSEYITDHAFATEEDACHYIFQNILDKPALVW